MLNGPELWNSILSQMPPGAIIAGGAIRDFLLDAEPKDIDVFMCSSVFPADGIPGFLPLGDDRPEEYEAMTEIDVVVRGKINGFQVDVIGVGMGTFDPRSFVETFDFGITRCWFDGEIHDTPEAFADREASTVTLLLNERIERSYARFDRFNERHGGSFRLVEPE